MAREELAKALIVTAEVMGYELSPIAAEVMARDLATYPPADVARALERTRRECRGKLTLADVLARIDGGHLGAEEAWSLAQQARDESVTVIWTDEISEAFGAAAPLLEVGDDVGARMAFREAYSRLLREAREAKRPAKWLPSLGQNQDQRARALLDAVERGRLAPSYASNLLPSGERFDRDRGRLAQLASGAVKGLSA